MAKRQTVLSLILH